MNVANSSFRSIAISRMESDGYSLNKISPSQLQLEFLQKLIGRCLNYVRFNVKIKR